MIVIDTSGSMSSGNRVSMAKAAAKKVIDTFAWTDYATVVAFGDSARLAHPALQKMDGTNKNALKAWVNTNIHSNGGGTDFDDAFEGAFDVFNNSPAPSSSSGCEKVILFMTDGQSSVVSTQAVSLCL